MYVPYQATAQVTFRD